MRQEFRGLAAASLVVGLCLFSGSSDAGEQEAARLDALRGRIGLHVRRGDARKTPIVLLHGICGEPKNSCAAFAPFAGSDLVCARGDMECPAGGAMWSGGAGAIGRIDRAIAEASDSGVRFDPSAPRVLVGFSQGAYVALRAARAAPGKYPRVMLIGAFVSPSRADLEAAGITRLALAAGDLDGASRTMRETTQKLVAEGFDARFVSLGRVGHTYVPDDAQKLATAVDWTTGK